MKSLREVVQEYKKAGRAIGHFNVSDSNQLRALADAAKETGLPVIAGLSEGERDFFRLPTPVRLLIYVSQNTNLSNADHTYSVERWSAR